MGKHLQALALIKNTSPVLLGTLAAMFVTCYMFLILCFDLSPIMISALKNPHFKTKKNHKDCSKRT